MPSPLAHAMTGLAAYYLFRRRGPRPRPRLPTKTAPLVLVALGLSLLPDVDAVAGLLLGDFSAYHNNVTNSLIVGLCVSLAVAVGVWIWGRSDFRVWLMLCLLCYELHVLMDYFTIGRGVMLLWPFSGSRFTAPVHLFYGLHWSDGWITIRHLWTLLTELAFGGLLLLAILASSRRRAKTAEASAESEPTADVSTWNG